LHFFDIYNIIYKKKKIPLRVSFFVWTTTLGKILTLDNLCKRGIIVVGWCRMCKHSGESCEVAQALWSMVFSLFVVTRVMLGGVVELLPYWRGQRGNISSKEV
jgi:hypothetical protein